MIKKLILTLLSLSIFLGLFLGVSSPSFSQPYSGYSVSTDYLEIKEHAAGEKPDALKGIGEVLGAELAPFKLEHSLPEEVKVNEIGFRVEGISKEDIKNIELVVDENANGTVEREEPRVGGLGQVEVYPMGRFVYITFAESFTVSTGATNYILKADLSNLVLGDRMIVTPVSDRTNAETVSGEQIHVLVSILGLVHIAGNLAPTLSWPQSGPAQVVGVHPRMGKSGDEFTFVVEYTDPDNNPPVLAQVWIDENDNGSYEESEKYNLDQSLPTNKAYRDGILYEKTLNVFSVGDGEFTFRFRFSDGELEAGGKPVEEKTFLVSPLAVTQVWLENPKFVSGHRVMFNVAVVSFINVKEIQETSLEDLAKTELSPFKIEKVTLGEKKPLDDTRDFQTIRFLLSLSDDLAGGEYTIPPFEIPYSFTISVGEQEKEIQGVVTTRPIPVEKVLLVVLPEVDKKTMMIGDKIHLTFSLIGEKDLRIHLGNLLEGGSEEGIGNLSVELTKKVNPEVIQQELKEKLTFGAFELLDARFYKEHFGPVNSWVCDFTLSFYGLEGTEDSGWGLGAPRQILPCFRVLYYLPPEEIEAEKKIETQEVVTEPIVIKVNSVLTPSSRFEDIKGALTSDGQKFFWFPLLTGGLGLLVLVVIAMGQLTKRGPKKEEVLQPWRIAKEGVERLVSYYSYRDEKGNKAFLEALRRDFGRYLGALIGESQGQARTSSELGRRLEASDKIESRQVKSIREILRELDQLVFGEQASRREQMEEILEGVKEALRELESAEEVLGKNRK